MTEDSPRPADRTSPPKAARTSPPKAARTSPPKATRAVTRKATRTSPHQATVESLLQPAGDTPPGLMCSIARSLCVVGERWTFLILREAFFGAARFSEFRDRLGVAPDVLTDRLATLTEAGVLAREPYQEPGRRGRYAYRLTPAGQELRVVLASLQQWGDEHLPPPGGPTVIRRARDTGRPVHVGFVDDQGHEVALPDVEFVRTASYPS